MSTWTSGGTYWTLEVKGQGRCDLTKAQNNQIWRNFRLMDKLIWLLWSKDKVQGHSGLIWYLNCPSSIQFWPVVAWTQRKRTTDNISVARGKGHGDLIVLWMQPGETNTALDGGGGAQQQVRWFWFIVWELKAGGLITVWRSESWGWHWPYMHSSCSSPAPPTAPCPGTPGCWRCRSSRSDSPPAGSAWTRRSSAEDEAQSHRQCQIMKGKRASRLTPPPPPPPPGVPVLGVHRELLHWEPLVRGAHRVMSDPHSAQAPHLRL